MTGRNDLNAHFDVGVFEMLQNAQRLANDSGKSIRVGGRWVNPSSSALAKRPKASKGNQKSLPEYPKGD